MECSPLDDFFMEFRFERAVKDWGYKKYPESVGEETALGYKFREHCADWRIDPVYYLKNVARVKRELKKNGEM